MRVRSIDQAEIEQFARSDDWFGLGQGTKAYVEMLWQEGQSKPEWCFVTEENGFFVGRVVYWALPTFPPMEIELLALPWESRYLEVGTLLFKESLAHVQMFGSTRMTCTIQVAREGPTARQTLQRDRCIAVLEDTGFSLRRESYRFEWRPPTDISPSKRLQSRTLNEVGETVFVDAILRVSEGALDRALQSEQRKLTPVEAAKERFDVSKGLKYEPTWWQLAYQEGDLVGLVMPAENDGGPIIAYVGIVPEHRGRGYIDDVLAQGTRVLASAGAPRIRADTDTRNFPMVAAFRRAGYRQFAMRMMYRIDL